MGEKPPGNEVNLKSVETRVTQFLAENNVPATPWEIKQMSFELALKMEEGRDLEELLAALKQEITD